MKSVLRIIFLINPIFIYSQITTPVIRARFGIDGELRANYFNGAVQTGNDDWYNLVATDTSGKYVIDTTGAAGIVAGYATDVSPWPKRMASFYRTMSWPTYSVVNNRLWLDALFVRDYHGTDTTALTVGSKNGQSPRDWTPGIQAIPDKNDILDIFVHIRRAGPNTTDSLWMFGGLSLDNTTGNRYFDFEMYQTDIYYDRVSQKFYNYGVDSGHTAWSFDPLGNAKRPGDIIFSASYQSSTLTNIEARIWVNQAALSMTPAQFDWGGAFDGATPGATFGYASIVPKTAGAFYTGLGCGNNTWAGPFKVVLQDNSVATNYIKDQFMEFSVNLSKLGLDPVGSIGGDICGSPFRRIIVKTRASASFTADLKDFVAPTDLFLAPRVDARADIPIFCGSMGVATIAVQNPWPSSVYTWSTWDGHILGPTTGTSITADAPGHYVVMQQLAAGCNPYAYDTVTIVYDSTCVTLEKNILSFTGSINNKISKLDWRIAQNQQVSYFDIQRSFDGRFYDDVGRVNADGTQETANYSANDDLTKLAEKPFVYYRLKITKTNGSISYSKIIKLPFGTINRTFAIAPNPVKNTLLLTINTTHKEIAELVFYDMSGKVVRKMSSEITPGGNVIPVDNFTEWQKGMYLVVAKIGDAVFRQKFVLTQ